MNEGQIMTNGDVLTERIDITGSVVFFLAHEILWGHPVDCEVFHVRQRVPEVRTLPE